ncbi:leucine-rich repeat protein [Tanacetum coccineum]
MKSPQAVIYLSTSSPISFLIYGLVITCLTSATVSASYGSNETDYHALLNNSFQGAIPHELGRLSRLRHLYLNRNNFIGVIPVNLSSCSNLEVLTLARNKLVGSIPKDMSLLSKLTNLEISKNKLTGGIPSFLANLSVEGYASVLAEHPVGVYFGWTKLSTRGFYKMAMSIWLEPILQ